MATSSLRNLDLNLLLTLDALLHERNVTRAAERLGLSQPAVSAALGRLRRHFDDELLDRSGNRYTLTPLAEQLVARTSLAIAGVQRVFDATPDFDPATADREFSLMVSDYAATVLGDHLATLVEREAPGVRLRFVANSPYAVDRAVETLRTVDGIVLPHGFITDFPAVDLYEDTWVCVVAHDNDQVGDELTLDDLARLPWVVTYHLPTAFTPAARQLRMIGVEPDVHIVVDSFLSIPFLIAGTRRVAVLQSRLAERLARVTPIRALPCPWDVVPLKEAFWWHPQHRTDPAHVWLRGMLAEAGRAVDGEGAPRRRSDGGLTDDPTARYSHGR
ncbi:LysR family transcriptional regulator [Mumia flava]|uniref:LysR family transcriptional regulator n=1 Tax=Mumia flava TaxID=1348852 RepID=UPI000AD1DE6C|nr:LysR family transcriptional regulator [Mumia flava]